MRIIALIILFLPYFLIAQTSIIIYPDSLTETVDVNFRPGVFYIPKTEESVIDFTENDIYQNSIRTHVIESVLNNATSLEEAVELLETVETDLVLLSEKCEKVVFIFEKMPVWLSSSADGSPAITPGWFVLNTKRPSDWNEWEAVVMEITEKIVNDFGISNAYFEVWNEPDLGSWTDSKDAYFELYKRTYDGIKMVDTALPVGGPAVNFWGNNIYWKPGAGYLNFESADSSLIAEVIDYGLENDRIPDFVSWHLFDVSYQNHKAAAEFVKMKCAILGIDLIETLVSEWNVPSALRDGPLAVSYVLKSQLEISANGISNNMIAAWQDFEDSPSEFHSDYGLITYGGIHKPIYYATLLSNEVRGQLCKTISDQPSTMIASAHENELTILISNYAPPAFIEALNHTLYEGEVTALDLVEAGYIDLETADFSVLIELYEEDIIISPDNPVNSAIIDAIPIYEFYKSIEDTPQTFNLILNNYFDNYEGSLTVIDDVSNNNQFKYDSLLSLGYTQALAREFLVDNQSMVSLPMEIIEGAYSIDLKPNAVALISLIIEDLGEIEIDKKRLFSIYPNPSKGYFVLTALVGFKTYDIYNLNGTLVQKVETHSAIENIDVSHLAPGLYLISPENSIDLAQKLIIK